MQKNRYHILNFIYILFIGLLFNACSVDDSSSLKVPQTTCPKPLEKEIPLKEKELSINIDKVVMIMPQEEKKDPLVIPQEKKPVKKVIKVKKKPVLKPKKTVVIAPKKLITKKKDLKKIEKNVGDKICRNGSGLLSFMPIELIGKVQAKKSDTIQVKIIDSYSDDKPMYNGIGLYKNTIIWDKYYNWKLCK